MKVAYTVKKIIRRRKGITLVEVGLSMIAGILILIGGVFGWGEIQYRLAKSSLVSDVQEISSGADSWKAFRPGYTGVSMTVLCAAGQQNVSSNTCGGVGGSGANTNPYGGSYAIGVSANVSQKDLVISDLPAERITDLADTLASQTIDRCDSATGCATIDVTGTTITLTM